MAVDDYGIEVLKKSAEQVTPGDKTDYYLKMKNTDDNNNNLFTTNYPGRVDFPESYFDDFGRIMVAEPRKLIEYSANHAIDETRYHSTSTSGSGTVTRNATKTQIELATDTASGDEAIFQTRRNIQYNKANAQQIFIIYRPNPIANRRERWGYFDTNNGLYFEHDGTTAKIVVRSNTSGSVVNTTFTQDQWDDPLDGTGQSGLTVDWTKQTIFMITFGWLSAKGARFYIDIGGTVVLVKKYYISNQLAVPFMATAQLPIRFEVTNTGTVGAATTSSFTCFAVQSSGSEIQEGPVRTVSTGAATFSITTTPTIFAAIRLKSTFLNSSVQPLDFHLLPASGNTFAIWEVLYNPTLVGDVWATPTDGVVDTLTSVTSYSGGSVIATGHLPLSNKTSEAIDTLRSLLSDVYLGRGIDNSRDALCMVLYTDSSTGTVFFHGQYKEFS